LSAQKRGAARKDQFETRCAFAVFSKKRRCPPREPDNFYKIHENEIQFFQKYETK
jgi:hypothetical protein